MANRMNQAERNLLRYLQSVNDTPSDTDIVQAVAALPDDEDRRESAISSLRWGCDEQDWLACAAQANALGVEEI